ncbi:MAG: PhzF family phenazine biosynthesis protein [Clostridiales bacterium]|jgi:PhzF family phenazine biosynthesis protein|nr:PhzF family phenazine biosynthesis protein [Clostridiales bacterium]HOC08286.1 PhzF family phenazine biosynthesis protein [Bacillota bacterium]HQA48493.1 PhzF family phenazine biosynthesis protein [Bacillota bacterium]HQD42430.1 PhzF family phenazine biosynthesis protein [Bacillota bacterium]
MKVYKVNAFTYRGMGGNGAGVVRCIDFPPPEVMQKAASVLGFSETVFIRPVKGGYHSRFYTPECEVPTCGHATIAAFFLLSVLGEIRGGDGEIKLRQETGEGSLPVYVRFRQGRVDKIFMEQSPPKSLGRVKDRELEELCRCLGLDPANIGVAKGGDVEVEIISTGLPDIMVPVTSRIALDRISPDFSRLANLSRRLGVVGAHVFTMETGNDDFTVLCRNFGPAVGINEESATGTSNGALGYYLYKRGLLPGGEMVSGQGHGMGNPSTIYVRVEQGKVLVGGKAAVAGALEMDL